MVKLVFSDSLKCALSHDIYHNLIFSRRHVENLTRKKTSKLVKTGSSNLLTEMKRYAFALLYFKYNLSFVHHIKVIHAKKHSNRTSTKNFKRF